MNLKRRFSCAVLAFITLLKLSPAAPAAEIVGEVLLSGRPAADAVISIEGLRLEGSPDGKVYVIDHRDLNFVPHVVVARAGARVRFENSDGMPCLFYSISPAGLFALRRQDGKPLTVTFDRPGVIEVRCSEHRKIYAYVVIKPNPYFALADPKGRYKISHVPPGRYTLQAWYEGQVVEAKTIAVGTEKLTIDFQASRPQPKLQTGPGPDGNSLAAAPLWGGLTSVSSEAIQ